MKSAAGDSGIWDVVVVGAGPAGSTMTARLAREGLSVLLLDKSAAGPPPKVCGEYLSPGCLPILRRLGALSAVRAVGRPLYGMAVHTAAGRLLRMKYPDAGPASEEPVHGLSVTRARLDAVLLDLAVKSGVVVETGFQVSDVRRNGSSLEVCGRLRGGETRRRARLVVGADGRHSAVARQLGFVRRHPWLDKLAFVAYVEGARRAGDIGEIFLGRDCYAILNPIADDLTNLGVVVNRCDVARGDDPRQSLWSTARGMAGLGDRLRTATLAAPGRCLGPLAYRVTSLSGPGVLLVGDAAGFLDPFTGEGIYAALRSAELAARRVLSGWTCDGPLPSTLAAYARDWKRERDPKWRLCTGLQHAIRRPWLAEWLVARLRPRPALTTTLMAAVGDLAWMPTLRRSCPIPRLRLTSPRPDR
jgi:geranylgeranyl reductase family protein